MKAKSRVRITSRGQLVARIKRELERRGFPRLQMMLLVLLTGGAGFLASFSLLSFGVDALAVRYPLAVGIAYLVFLLLLWLWLRVGSDSYDGFGDAVLQIMDSIPEAKRGAADAYRGGGGQFGGGGSGAQWESKSIAEPLVELPEVPVGDIGEVASADELAIPVAVVLIVLGVLLTVVFASASVVYAAPVLFAEMLVDGVLAATLYRRLRRIESRHWLQSAIRRTIVPFAVTAILLSVAGWGLSLHAPEARTLGEVFVRSST